MDGLPHHHMQQHSINHHKETRCAALGGKVVGHHRTTWCTIGKRVVWVNDASECIGMHYHGQATRWAAEVCLDKRSGKARIPPIELYIELAINFQ